MPSLASRTWSALEGASKSPKSAMALSLAYAIAIVLLGLRLHIMGDGDAESDFFEAYVPQARAVLDGRLVIDPYRGPVYPVILAVFHAVLRVFGFGLFESGIVLSATAGGAVLLMTWRLVARLFSPLAGTLVALFLLTNAYFLQYSYTTGNDMVFTALATATIYSFLRDGRRARSLIATGVLAALTFLTRYNGATIMAAILVAGLLVNVWRLGWGRRIATTSVVLAAFIVTVLPWSLYCQAEKGRVIYNKNYVNIALAFYVDEELDAEPFLKAHGERFDGIIDVVMFDPARFAAKLPGLAYAQFTRLMRLVMRPIGVLVWLALVLLIYRRLSRWQLAYLIIALAFYSALCLVFFNPRFNLFLIPAFTAFAVGGVLTTVRILGDGRPARWIAGAVVVGLLGYSARVSYAHNRTAIRGGRPEFREMAEWLAQQLPPGPENVIVVARKPHFAYFAGVTNVRLPDVDSYEELLWFIHKEKADYLFFSSVAALTRPELRSLKDPQIPHRGLRPLLAGPVAVLYEVVD